MNSPIAKRLPLLLLLLAASCAVPKAGEPQTTPLPAYRDPCAGAWLLELRVEKAAASPFGFVESGQSPPRLSELGIDAAQELAGGLRPAGQICELPVSSETRAVIEQAQEIAAGGKSAEALELLEQRLELLTSSAGNGHLLKPRLNSGGWRSRVRDLFAMAEAAYNLGGDPRPFHSAAEELFRAGAGGELAGADLAGALRIEAEAELFAAEDLAEQARQRVDRIAAEMIDAALEDFDPCAADREAVVTLLNTAAQAALLGVEGLEPGEARYEAVKSKSQLALSHQWNAYVRQKGLSETLLDPVPPCSASGELEVKIFSICSQNWPSVGTIPFRAEPGDGGTGIRGQGHIAFSEQAVIGGELDCSVSIDADVVLSGAFADVVLSGAFLEEAGVRRIEFSPSFSSDGHYLVVGRTTPIRDEGVYPFNGYGAFVMPWVDGSAHPSSGETIVRFILHIVSEK